MRVVVYSPCRFKIGADGKVWTSSTNDYKFFIRRYLNVFDEVRILCRVQHVCNISDNWKRVDGEGVSVYPLPYYVGPERFLLKAPLILKVASKALASDDAVILRNSEVCWWLAYHLSRTRRPYGLEVVGEPLYSYTRSSTGHPLSFFFTRLFSIQLKRMASSARAVAYVTKNILQKRYPPNKDAFTTHYSNVDLLDDAFASVPRNYNSINRTFKLILVGSMAQRYKGFDILIGAVKECVDRGLNLQLTLVGDGRYRAEFDALTKTLRLQHLVSFTGELPGPEAVRQVLMEADLYVHPSRAEGLPRALIEAMAQGLPCIGSNVGGIPELLPPEDLVEPGDVKGLAAKICEVLSNPERMNRMSERNLSKAREFHYSVLQKRRDEFYRYVRKCTEEYLARSSYMNQKL